MEWAVDGTKSRYTEYTFFAVVAALTHIISRPTEVIGSPTGPEEGIYVVFLPVVAHMGIFSKYYVYQWIGFLDDF
jgi:hypothetical protein